MERREGGRGRWGGDSLVRRGLYICRPKGIPARIAFVHRMGESRRRPKLEIEHQHRNSHMGENICWRREQRRGPGARHGIRSRARSQGAKVGGSGARFIGQNRVRMIRLANLEGLRTIQLRTGVGGWSASPKQSSLPRHSAGSSGWRAYTARSKEQDMVRRSRTVASGMTSSLGRVCMGCV
jgi:hypothetical protein